MQENNRMINLIETTFKNLNNIVDVNTVVGAPIKTENGEYIVPISKVTIGVMMGGGEYGKVGIFKKSSDLPCSIGNGAVVSVKPSGFLIKEDGKYKILAVSEKSYEKVFDKAVDFLSDLTIGE